MTKGQLIGLFMAWCCITGWILPAKAQHYVSIDGTVSGYMTLPKLGHDSVYLVSQAMMVVEGGTLEIQAGAALFFERLAFLRVDGGSLFVEGTATEPVSFRPYELAHDWSGIQLKNIQDGSSATLSFAEVNGAVTALTASNCTELQIRHCEFNNVFSGKGIDMTDCDHSLVDSCSFYQCINGIELKSSTRDCVGNVFSHNLFDQGQINISFTNTSFGFKCRENYISHNCFQKAVTALCFDRIGGVLADVGKNYVLNNLISSGLPDGNTGYSSYGICMGMDSLIVRDNIFWKNDEAINMLKNCHLFASGNTFYGNGQVLTNNLPNSTTFFTRNVFCEAQGLLMDFPSADNQLRQNNIMIAGDEAVLFANRCPSMIDMQHNYWHGATAEDIENYILDSNDDPELGRILCDNFLDVIDTVAPISPPEKVKKQYINGQWRISWEENPEADLSHYVLYYGDFDCYKFKFHIDSIFGNTCIIPSHLTENVAVAACDRACDFQSYTPKGRSAYAFAEYYPYAGADATLCASAAGYQITDANIPYSYNNFMWRTSGSGVFSDPLSLRTTYFPSDEDFETGSVVLTLRVFSGDETRSASMVLRLFEQLSVFAGPDSYSDVIHPILLESAEALHYDSICWKTCGDGAFVDPHEVKALYYPGEKEKEQRRVKLALDAWSYCGHRCDTVMYELYDEFSLEGRTWCQGEPMPYTQVLAVAMGDDNSFATGFYRTVSDDQGAFGFGALLPDTYILYAFPDTLDMQCAGSYYLGDFQWNESNMIQVSGNVHDVDITLPETLPMAFGIGCIGGKFEYPMLDFKVSDFYCRPWLRADSAEYCTDGLSNVSVLLLNATKQRILGFTLTDETGHFSFRNLPFGTYYVMADVPRYGRGFCLPITLSPEHQEELGLQLYIDAKGHVAMAGQTNGPDDETLCLFPNPVTDVVKVKGLTTGTLYTVRILNGFGELLMSDVDSPQTDGSLLLPVSDLPRGVFFLQIECVGSCRNVKFIK